MDATSNPNGKDRYDNFAALAAAEKEGVDYRIRINRVESSNVAVVAPHGGSIERRTSAIARAIAGEDFNLYLLEGLDEAGSFDVLHITSHRFDEPRCLELVNSCDKVVVVHGCSGDEELVMLGGLDRQLISAMAAAMADIGIPIYTENHRFPGTHRSNICNRGHTGRGVQVEMTDGLRGGRHEAAVIAAIRVVLRATGQVPQA